MLLLTVLLQSEHVILAERRRLIVKGAIPELQEEPTLDAAPDRLLADLAVRARRAIDGGEHEKAS